MAFPIEAERARVSIRFVRARKLPNTVFIFDLEVVATRFPSPINNVGFFGMPVEGPVQYIVWITDGDVSGSRHNRRKQIVPCHGTTLGNPVPSHAGHLISVVQVFRKNHFLKYLHANFIGTRSTCAMSL